jgi:hypothetical protein
MRLHAVSCYASSWYNYRRLPVMLRCAVLCCAEVINLCVQQRAASRVDGTQQQSAQDPVSAAAAAVGQGAARVATQLLHDAGADLINIGDIGDSDENLDPAAAAAAAAAGAAGRGRGGSKAKGGMPPPAPKAAGRQRKGAAAAAAAGGGRQAGLLEAFARGGSQAGGTSPQGNTGSNLNGVLSFGGARGASAAGGGGGGSTPSQATSRSRSAAGSAARGRGSRGGRGGRGGRGRGRKSAESEELLDSDDGGSSSEGGGNEGISDSDEDERPAKKARGGWALAVVARVIMYEVDWLVALVVGVCVDEQFNDPSQVGWEAANLGWKCSVTALDCMKGCRGLQCVGS